jgi:beta-glucosidase/6-phospho-beta-glucosidase/beta-galactosidase
MNRAWFLQESDTLTGSAELSWLRCVPWGMRKLLNYIYKKYQTPIYITENVSLTALVRHRRPALNV